MATTRKPVPPVGITPLRAGDVLTWPEFERRWQAMPELSKAELLDGVVRMPPPVSDEHSTPHFNLVYWLGCYRAATPGIVGSDNGTIRLDLHNAPQPDAFLRILPEFGGRARLDATHYVVGAPELVAEISVSSVAADLNEKLELYRTNDVQEYIVWRVPDRAVEWYVLRDGQYQRLTPDAAAVLRSETLPGLWLDEAALVRDDLVAVDTCVRQGTASPEHAAFVERLRQHRQTSGQ
jgi:Putative restriction endonuclease